MLIALVSKVHALGVTMAKNPFGEKIDLNLSDNRMDCTKGLNYTSFSDYRIL